MSVKAILVLCASALFVNTISGQCISRPVNAGCGSNGLAGYGAGLTLASNNFAGCNAGYGLAGNGYTTNLGNLASSSDTEFLVSSSSAVAPSGISVVSENSLEGALNVVGSLPFLTAAALEGQVASGGSAGVSYSYGNGNVGITGVNSGYATGGSGYGTGLAQAALAESNCLANAGLANIGTARSGLAGGYGARGCGCGRAMY